MSGSFYKRYVPSKAEPQADQSVSQAKAPFFNRYVPSVENKSLQSEDVEDPPPKRQKLPRREKPKPAESPAESQAHESSDGFEKHQTLKEKYTKVQKLSQKPKDEEESSSSGSDSDSDSGSASSSTSSSKPVVEKHGLEPLPQPVDNIVPTPAQAIPLPDWLAEPIKATGEGISMDSLPLSEEIRRNLKKRGYETAFAVQKAVIPLLLPTKDKHRGDICVAASTGSGKTLSYVLPMVEALKDKPVRLLRGLIVVPTRELVNQVKETLVMCVEGTDLKIGTSFGSRTLANERHELLERNLHYDPEAYAAMQRKYNSPTVEDLMEWDPEDSEDEYETPEFYVPALRSAVDILVCTPGRLVDHIRSTKGFTLNDLEWLVIDEADKLLDQSFQQWIDTVMPQLRWLKPTDEWEQNFRRFMHAEQRRNVQKVVLSATMTRDISKLLSLDLVNPRLVVLEGQQRAEGDGKGSSEAVGYEIPSNLREVAVPLGRDAEKPLVLLQILEELLDDFSTEKSKDAAILDKMDVDKGKSSESSSDTSSDDDDDGDEDDDSESDTESEDDSSSDLAASTSSSGSDSSGMSSDEKVDSSSLPAAAKHQNGKLAAHGKNEKTHGILVFASTNEAAQRLSRLLCLLRPQWRSRIGTLTKSTASSSGRRLLASLRSHRLAILVASDRASRGLDIANLHSVVNYDLPTSVMSYVHRVGRTARAGSTGTALTIVAHHEGRWFWNEIARSETIVRSAKVVRREGVGKEVSDETQRSYEKALKKLGAEARGTR